MNWNVTDVLVGFGSKNQNSSPSIAAHMNPHVQSVILCDIIRDHELNQPLTLRTRGVAQLASSWVRSTRNPQHER